jgi:wyosine [tRNA(Phe)-imidazoG37] synthetase (radical SAM superfamily)
MVTMELLFRSILNKKDAGCQPNSLQKLNRVPQSLYSFIWGNCLEIKAVPRKICPGDCVYCPYGKTTCKTIDRQPFYVMENLSREIESTICQSGPLKSIVIGGPGEPSLYSDLARLVDRIRNVSSVPIAVASCGTLLWRPSVHNDLHNVNSVFVTMDAADRIMFQKINHFHAQVPFARFIAGINDFRSEFSKNFYIRVNLVDGINTDEAHVLRLAHLVTHLDPTVIFVGTSPVLQNETVVPPVDTIRLQYLATLFGPKARVYNIETNDLPKDSNTVCFRKSA